MKIPQAYTNLSGRHSIRANQTMMEDVTRATEPAIEVEKNMDSVSNLGYENWLPFAAKTYHISPKIESYVVIPTPICPSDIPNRNGIGFPLAELLAYQPPPISRQSYKAWTGTPMHLEHDNEDPTKAYGVVLDSIMTPIKGYGGGRFWKVMGLAAVDKDKYPDIAQELLDGTIQTFSMGALADYFTCSVCGRQAYNKKDRYRNCSHIEHTEAVNFSTAPWEGSRALAFLNAHVLSPIELSIVRDPAWVVANSDQIIQR